jgi:hypothetical protein
MESPIFRPLRPCKFVQPVPIRGDRSCSGRVAGDGEAMDGAPVLT